MLPTLSGLVNLESLHLNECPVSEPALAALGRLDRLQELDLTRLNVFRYGVSFAGSPTGASEFGLTDACLPPLVGLPRLRALSLAGNRITDKGMVQIGRMRGLEDLDLSATDITDNGLVHLQSLKNLKTLNVTATLVTPDGLKRLQQAMPGLEISQEFDTETGRKSKSWHQSPAARLQSRGGDQDLVQKVKDWRRRNP